MIKRAVGYAITLLVVFGLSLLLIPTFGILLGVLNQMVKGI